jgi:hypothetical protein
LVECTRIIPNAIEVPKITPNGKPMLDVVVGGPNGRINVSLQHGQTKNLEGLELSFNDSANIHGTGIFINNSGMFIRAPFEITAVNMGDQSQEGLQANTLHPFHLNMVYAINGIQFLATNFYPSAEIDVVNGNPEDNSPKPTALKLKVTVETQTKDLIYLAGENTVNEPVLVSLAGVNLSYIKAMSRVSPRVSTSNR